MAFQQSSETFANINSAIMRHLEERDWQNNPPRGLAISIALEAAELMEHYQWSDNPIGNRDELAAELADILIYAFEFAQVNEIDMAEAIKKKLKKSAEKYPAEAFKNKTSEERRTAWIDGKRNYQKEEIL
jgi:NTP pyrophosphatase (non-canonical NTP hydrolase)